MEYKIFGTAVPVTIIIWLIFRLLKQISNRLEERKSEDIKKLSKDEAYIHDQKEQKKENIEKKVVITLVTIILLGILGLFINYFLNPAGTG